jgi:hypothetical protein
MRFFRGFFLNKFYPDRLKMSILCLGLRTGFELRSPQASSAHTATSHDPVPVPPGQTLGFVYGFEYGWKLRLALGSCSAQVDLISDQQQQVFTIRSNFSFHT